MENTKDLITDKAIKLVIDDYTISDIYKEKNIRKFIYENLTNILKGYDINSISRKFLYQLALINHDMKITEIGREYIYLYHKEKKEVDKMVNEINKVPLRFTKNLEFNKNKSFKIIAAEGDENNIEITEIKLNSTGEKIEKGDTVYDKISLKYLFDINFDNLSENMIQGKYHGDEDYSNIPIENIILKNNNISINVKDNDVCYLLYDVNGDKKYITFDKEFAYNTYNGGGHVLNEYPVYIPTKK